VKHLTLNNVNYLLLRTDPQKWAAELVDTQTGRPRLEPLGPGLVARENPRPILPHFSPLLLRPEGWLRELRLARTTQLLRPTRKVEKSPSDGVRKASVARKAPDKKRLAAMAHLGPEAQALLLAALRR
jgi:hypothetical protein